MCLPNKDPVQYVVSRGMLCFELISAPHDTALPAPVDLVALHAHKQTLQLALNSIRERKSDTRPCKKEGAHVVEEEVHAIRRGLGGGEGIPPVIATAQCQFGSQSSLSAHHGRTEQDW